MWSILRDEFKFGRFLEMSSNMRILVLGVRFEPNLRDGGEPFLFFECVRKLEEAVQYDVT